ncbi:MAG: SDR family oxidoreductase [Thermoleophilia bacterium]|jgi:NAD(P)-dependent dehydrogenase (short-subunit alcohol dehydrogenase family)
MTSEFENRVVLITGAAGGIGKAVAGRFLGAGAQVFAADLRADLLEAAVGELGVAPGATIYPIEADVTMVADCERMVAVAVAGAGRLDVLVNCAGVWVEGPSDTMTEADWERVLSVNLKGTFFCCRYAIPELRKTQGCIVNISSKAGVVGTQETAIYTASKGAVNLLTKSLALELAPDLVRVNAVCPADVATPMLRYQADTYGRGDPEGYLRRRLDTYAQGERARFIRPDEVAELVYYLAGEMAAPITGAVVSIDFGTSAGYRYA